MENKYAAMANYVTKRFLLFHIVTDTHCPLSRDLGQVVALKTVCFSNFGIESGLIEEL